MAAADPATRYARAVVKGNVVAGELVRLGCRRHLNNLEQWGRRPEPGVPFWFDVKAAAHGMRWFDFLRHYRDAHAHQPFILEPWEQFAVGSLHGWKKDKWIERTIRPGKVKLIPARRFQNAWMEIGKKNGKTPLAAGLGLQFAIGDGVEAARVVTAATKREQARLVFDDMVAMAENAPALAKHLEFLANGIFHRKSRSRIEPLSRDTKSAEGFNLNAAVIDEIHVHRDKKVYTTIKGAFATASQPMLLMITTAGEEGESIGMELHRLSVYILEGVIPDETWFAYIAAVDENDDPFDPAVWPKANPNLGVSVNLDFLEAEATRAQASPVLKADFERYHCNRWVEASNPAIDKAAWAACGAPFDPALLEGRPCYGGLDLAEVHDLSALVLVFPPLEEPPADDGLAPLPDDAPPPAPDRYHALAWFWCPEDDILTRSTKDNVPYNVWRDEGHILTTPGNATDFRFIRRFIEEDLAKRFNILEIAYDRWHAEQLQTDLSDAGLTMVPFGQGFVSMAPACNTLDRALLARELRHGGHPILTWNSRNLIYASDPAGNHKPDKAKAPERIDGMVALIMGLHRATINQGEDETSIYESEELFVI